MSSHKPGGTNMKYHSLNLIQYAFLATLFISTQGCLPEQNTDGTVNRNCLQELDDSLAAETKSSDSQIVVHSYQRYCGTIIRHEALAGEPVNSESGAVTIRATINGVSGAVSTITTTPFALLTLISEDKEVQAQLNALPANIELHGCVSGTSDPVQGFEGLYFNVENLVLTRYDDGGLCLVESEEIQ